MKANRGEKAAVLIVEDDDDIRQILTMILEDEGFIVVGAANGAEALKLLREGRRVGLIMLDLLMPVMNGWEFREEQMKDRRLAAVPLVVMTACGARPGAMQSFEHVASLPKPARLRTVVETVRRHFAG